MQRLFSTFANGWPSGGLLILRLLTSVVLLPLGIASLLEGPSLQIVILQIIAVVNSALILVGFRTPLAGMLAMIVNLWIALIRYSSH